MSFDVHDVARFWSKVNVRDEGECWPWRAYQAPNGYGEFKVRTADKSAGAHRVAFAIFNGVAIEELGGLVVRHSCDNRICCNPFHLSTGSHNDNVADRVQRGRSAKGVGNGNHKLVEGEVLAILADTRSNSEIARSYDVHTDTIRCIKIGKTWRHITANHANDNPITPIPTFSCARPAPESQEAPKVAPG